MRPNTAINPTETPYTVAVTPCRALAIKSAQPMPGGTGSVGGYTKVKSGIVYVPSDDSAQSRTIRLHESLHAQYSQPGNVLKDILDQALEDSRLHRFFAKTATSPYQRARRDELTTALRDLRKINRSPILKATASVVTLRSLAMLTACEIKPAHEKLLNSVLLKFSPDARKVFTRAIQLTEHTNGIVSHTDWQSARGLLERFFALDFSGCSPKPAPGGDSDEESSEESTQKTESKSDTAEESDSLGESSEDYGEESSDSSESDAPKDPAKGEDSGSDSDKPSSDGASAKVEIEAPEVPKIPKKSKPNPDLYTADLTPACDAPEYERMQHYFPQRIYIRRLDMEVNRIRFSLGRFTPRSATTGQHIITSKLALARVNPNIRMFSRKISQGGAGTILIDASGSMNLPVSVLIKFLENAPALTLAYYNAPSDHSRHGNIFIYAANGYRASLHALTASYPLYGSGNVIDYQAMAWLIKQPGPRYLVTDSRFTGPWEYAALSLRNKLITSKQIVLVHTIKAMQIILDKRKISGA